MNEPLAWKDVIDKKVVSIDDKDLGKVQSVSTDFIQVKDGKVSAKHYFIPKYYLEGYDEDGDIRVAITKDEAKHSFEGEAPVTSVLAGPTYIERRQAVLASYPDFDAGLPPYRSMAASPGAISPGAVTSEAVVIPWEDIVDKKVQTDNGDDVGKVKSIGPDFIEVEEGTASKHRYYIPRYYVEGFDGDKVHLAPVISTKEVLRSDFEYEKPPTASEMQTASFLERKRAVDEQYPQFAHSIPWLRQEPPTEIPVDYSGTTYNIAWDKLIHKHVRAANNEEIGYVDRVGEEFIVVRPGTGAGGDRVYYVPKAYIRDFDGSQLWIDAAAELIYAKFVSESGEPSREHLRMLARDSPRLRKVSASGGESSTPTRGPAVLWGELKGKEVKTSDSKTLGEIKETSANYLRIEKGTIKKENKFWIPKFMFDVYDGKHVWLMTTEEETMSYLKSQEPTSNEEYTRDFEAFRSSRPKGWDPALASNDSLRYRQEAT